MKKYLVIRKRFSTFVKRKEDMTKISTNITIIAEFTVAPENLEPCRKLLRQLQRKTITEEDNCLMYMVNQVSGQENTFLVYEIFKDKEAQDFHKETEHYKEILKKKIEPLLIDKKVRYLL
jgi:quinol monooxygenase YgiN